MAMAPRPATATGPISASPSPTPRAHEPPHPEGCASPENTRVASPALAAPDSPEEGHPPVGEPGERALHVGLDPGRDLGIVVRGVALDGVTGGGGHRIEADRRQQGGLELGR